MSNIRGIQEKHEKSAQKLTRDTRSLGERIDEFVSQPEVGVMICITGIINAIMFPASSDLLFLCISIFFWYAITRKHTLPFRLPKSSGVFDYNDLIPGTFNPKKSGGIAHIGNDRMTKEEIWFNNDDMRTHVLIFGSTGSGKTESLVSIAFNALVHGSGFIYVDGKGDNSLFAKVFSMVRGMGREDDMLLINFMTGARDVLGPQENRLSNTMNPFANGSSSMISQLAVSLMDSGSGGGNGDMWKGRAINFVESLLKILCKMRDDGHILIDAGSIRDYFLLEKLESIVIDKQFPIGDMGGRTIDISDVDPTVLEPLKNYILNLPGYNPQSKGDQAGEVREQHGFITMQLTKVFGSLADTYGHIMRTNLAEVDLKDIVLNRRILVVLLPALEKSPDELANLGKVIIASLKAMMAAGLGDSVEGDYRDVILRKPTTSPSPFICIMDEYGYYAVQGFAVVPAQARSLGFSAIFAGQDLPAFQKASKEEAASIGANCNIKICMKLEDPQETYDFFNKVAGEAYVTSVAGFQSDIGSVTANYADNKSANVDKRQRIDLLDLKDQREGECHIFFKSRIIRAEMFYANPAPVKQLKINHLLKVEKPDAELLIGMSKRLNRIQGIFNSELPEMELEYNQDIAIMQASLANSDDVEERYERGLIILIAQLENEIDMQQQVCSPLEDDYDGKTSCLFSKIYVWPLVEAIIGVNNVELFSLPLLRKGSTLDEIKHIERYSGISYENANSKAQTLVDELEQLTLFPEFSIVGQQKKEYLNDLNFIISMLGGNVTNEEISATTAEQNVDIQPESNLIELTDIDLLTNILDEKDIKQIDDMELSDNVNTQEQHAEEYYDDGILLDNEFPLLDENYDSNPELDELESILAQMKETEEENSEHTS